MCLKSGGSDSKEISEKVKIKTEIFFTPPPQLFNSRSWTSAAGSAPLPDVMESNNDGDDDDENGIPIPKTRSSAHTHQTRSGSSKPGSGPSSFRSRTMSASSAASTLRRGRSRFRKNYNVLKSVEVKGEKSFVLQTEGKCYTYTAEDCVVAHRWVQEIKNIPVPLPET
ncbi:uncharacterized protein EI90DRAFT_3154460 [Cantharellus anzutake]|nr:uncharacterized protein EI90DRAFT_3154460 [Cantharellus anzutake]KAF8332110.1 hypothetical protein EI90DRAFT_3154460 [Cantharellus anzutake]